MKGQVFTLDVLASLVLITVVLGYFTFEFERVSWKSSDVEFQRMQSIASDISQIGAKRALISDGKPNYVSTTNFNTFVTLATPMFGNYAGNITLGSKSAAINSGCEGRADIAMSMRPVVNSADSKPLWLVVEVCQ
jgi:hypothetical protein